MVRRILLILLAALLPLCALAQTAQVVDPSDVLSDEAEEEIARLINQIEAEYPVDLIVLVTFGVPDDDTEALSIVQAYADDFYDQGGYGVGGDRSGMIYLIDLNNGVQYVSTCGEMIGMLDDERLDAVLNAAYPFLVQGDWGGGAREALRCVWACLGEYAVDCVQNPAEAVPQMEGSPAGMLLMGGECL